MSEDKHANEATTHSSWRICRICAANVRNAGIIGTGWLVAYNEAAQKGDFAQAQAYLDDFETQLDQAALAWDDAQAYCREAEHLPPTETGAAGEREPGREASHGEAPENATQTVIADA